MQPIQAVLLGGIQGLTEFLPVSSSGHLVLLQNLFGLKEPQVLFDIGLHVGTLLAVAVVFFSEIQTIAGTLLALPVLMKKAGGLTPLYRENEAVRMAALIVVGSVPTAFLGFLFHKIVDRLFGAVWIVGLTLLATGILLWLTRRAKGSGRSLRQMDFKNALMVGLVQGVAIIPGISRSGSTIAAALLMGIDRDVAGRYSFLLSIPAILGALVLSLDAPAGHPPMVAGIFLLGLASAAVVGFAALKVLLHLVRRGRLYLFAPYCWVLGILALVLSR